MSSGKVDLLLSAKLSSLRIEAGTWSDWPWGEATRPLVAPPHHHDVETPVAASRHIQRAVILFGGVLVIW